MKEYTKNGMYILLSLSAIFGILLMIMSVNIISDGEVGVKKTLGNYNDNELTTGVYFIMPMVSSIEKVNIKESKIDESASVPTKDGLIVGLDITVIAKIRADRASDIKQTISGDIRTTKVSPYIRNGIRDIVSEYDSSSVYTNNGRKEISSKLKTFLEGKLEKNIMIIDVLLRDVKLPEKVTKAIEEKLDKQQQSQAKEYELDSAKKNAEIEIEKAKGVAEANKIIADSISPEYLQYKFIEGLNDGNTEVIYVPTEANIPIMEAMRLEK